jgi:urease accessory protein
LSERVGSGLSGNLHLVCAAGPDGRTYLSEQSFSAPIHISKSFWDGEALLVNIVNQTAGVFGGDRIVSRVTVGPGARVLLASPSAARFHPSRGRESRLEQTFEIAAGASLDFFPEISIPQRHSRSFQKTVIHIEPGGELIYLETLSPGRVASGESFAFDRYAWSTDISVGGRAVHRERASIEPPHQGLASFTALFPTSYYAGFVVISPAVEKEGDSFQRAVTALGDPASVRIGASRLPAHGWSIRLLAADSLSLRQSLSSLRALIYQRLGRAMPDLRRS